MVQKIGVMVVSTMLWTGLALSGAAAQTPSATQDQNNPARQRCIQDGGWYQKETGICEHEAKAKAALQENDRQTCERNGGWFQATTGVCEIETKTKK